MAPTIVARAVGGLVLWLAGCGTDRWHLDRDAGDSVEDAGFRDGDDAGLDATVSPPPPPPPPCTPRTGEPCAEGESCVYVGNETTTCAPEGPGQIGDRCETTYGCARTLMCWDEVCCRPCASPYRDLDDCEDGYLCWDIPPFGPFCLVQSPCDVLAQALCPQERMCAMVAWEEYTDCVMIGEGVQGDACGAVDDCGRGLQCHDDVCRQFCNAEGGEPRCDSGECFAAGYQSFSGAEVGYCY